MVQLRGMSWDHVRGVAPLVAAAEDFQRLHPDVCISWDKRSLKDFEDYPVEILARNYDLIMLDHPFIGSAFEQGIIVPLDDWMPEEYLRDQQENSVGRSFESYIWEGKQWALAVDAASQVSAYRHDLMQKLGLRVPKTWDDVFRLISELPSETKVGIPLNPTHAYSSFLALCANLGGQDFWKPSAGIPVDLGREALSVLQRLLPLVHHQSIEFNPIQMSDLMANSDEIVYVPLMFGYSNYARTGFASKVIHFTNIPSTQAEPVGGVLGGVGLAISAYSEAKKEAVDFAMYVGSGEYQRGRYFESGGQPGYRSAWTDPNVNGQCNGFFENTLRTLDLAFLRPRVSRYNLFQEQAGHMIHEIVKTGGDNREMVERFNWLYHKIENILSK